MRVVNALELIGNTPVLQLPGENIFVKLEKFNPGGSVKDRPALGMILDAEERGLLNKNSIIVEPTSGNMGIALALIGRLKGYRVVIVMPETMSVERRDMITAYGAQLILTEGGKGMNGAIAKAEELVRENALFFMPGQFTNPANPKIHYDTTAPEIIGQVPDLEIFAAGVGTGGTLSGTARRLKEYNHRILAVGVEPTKSAVLSGGQHTPHKIQGIGAGFIPATYDGDVVDGIVTITDEEAMAAALDVSGKLGILVGISSGANVAAARKLAEKHGKDKKIVTIAPDGGEKYFSMLKYS